MEFIAVIFSLLSVWLTSKENKLCWPIGILGVIGFMVIFYQTKDWGNFFLQFVFLFQSIKGWLNWDEKELKITNWENNDKISITISGTIIFFLLNYNLELLDSITTTLSLIGIYLLTKKKLQSWLFWMSADLLYILLFYQNKLYLSSGLYLLFLILGAYGFINWKKQIKNERN